MTTETKQTSATGATDRAQCMVCRSRLRPGFQDFCIPCWARVTDSAEQAGWRIADGADRAAIGRALDVLKAHDRMELGSFRDADMPSLHMEFRKALKELTPEHLARLERLSGEATR
jgi:hypothetical protein